jgi:hypothetical protein
MCVINAVKFKLSHSSQSGLAQRKRVGPITQRSEDRNFHPLIMMLLILFKLCSCPQGKTNIQGQSDSTVSCRRAQFYITHRVKSHRHHSTFILFSHITHNEIYIAEVLCRFLCRRWKSTTHIAQREPDSSTTSLLLDITTSATQQVPAAAAAD